MTSQFPDAEDAAAAAARFEQYKTAVRQHLADLRERAIAVATARMIGIPTAPSEHAWVNHLDQYDPALIRDMLVFAMWDGSVPAEVEAEQRLLLLRDVVSPAVLDQINGG